MQVSLKCILALPMFTVTPKNVEIQPNSTAYLDCKGAGDPKPTLFWSKEGSRSVIFEGSGIDNIRVSLEGTLQVQNLITSIPSLLLYVCIQFYLVDIYECL